jgi:hypothetical protein
VAEQGEGGSDAASRRAIRAAQLAALSPEELRAEIVRHASATWSSRGRLEEHARAHQRDFRKEFHRAFSAEHVDAFARAVVDSPDALFTEYTHRGAEWYFVRVTGADSAMIVVVSGGYRRTVYRAGRFSQWLQLHAAAIEVLR